MSPQPKRKCFLVCNAHLDPAWLWHWEDGLVTALSTFRVAADFCERHEDFVFNHNESLLYEWAEQHDAALFARIGDLVGKGKWHVAGGSYLQPDLIGTSGEALIRQFLVGKRYFLRAFGVEPTTAYCFDSFGHPQGMVQILAGCGFDSYIFCRPGRQELSLPVGPFRWRHRSGAEIVARRSDDHYTSQGHIRRQMRDYDYPGHYAPEGDFLYLWGIGNHGGGPSEAEYRQIDELRNDYPDIEFVESTPEAFFRHAFQSRPREDLPVVEGDMKPTYQGCYSSMQSVKTAYRRAENLLLATERLCAAAWWHGRGDYPVEPLQTAWKDLLFAEFHDILPGSGVPRVEQDSLALLGRCEEGLRRQKAATMIRLLADQPRPQGTEAPVFVFNPHAWPVTQDVEVEYNLPEYHPAGTVVGRVVSGGRTVPHQREKPQHNLTLDWRLRIAFQADVPPMSFRRYDVHHDLLGQGQRPPKVPAMPAGGTLKLGSREFSVFVNCRTGLIDGVRFGRSEVIGKGSFRPIVLDDLEDSWSTIPQWRTPCGRFRLASASEAARLVGSQAPLRAHGATRLPPSRRKPLRIIEDGPVRTTVEGVFVRGGSWIVQRYTVDKRRPVLRVEQSILWNEPARMLKLSVRHAKALMRAEAEKCCSIDAAEIQDGTEQDFQRFLLIFDAGGGKAFAVVSHGTLGYSARDGELRLTVLRSPAYAAMSLPREDDLSPARHLPHQSIGLSHSRFTFAFGALASCRSAAARCAWEENMPLEPFVYFPAGSAGADAGHALPPLEVGPENVLLTAVKKAEDDEGLILRLWETAGRQTAARIALGGQRFEVPVGPHCLRTVKVDRDGTLRLTDLLEREQMHADPHADGRRGAVSAR